MELKGKVALVTGAAQGIGEAVVKSLAEQGVSVAAIDKNAELLYKMRTNLQALNQHVVAFPVDISDRQNVDKVVENIESTMGPIDILINVAGVLRIGNIDTLSDDDWDTTFAVNTTGVFYICRAVIKNMKLREKGVIVTVGSNAASVPRIGMAAYAASKAAVTSFTKTMALELAEYNIRCNIVSPGSTETAMQKDMWKEDNGREAVIEGSLENYKLGIPLKKLAQPSDIANAVLFLVSDQSSHITMHNMCIDGGATLGV
ncbi:2,3-dihydro-2,3-dihydroxybenzoate dehydrogenase [Bacillus pseudomycoides]|nr:2,3-dihydro-2,3-dihydroxybenzoate dehydrogenase [Bacillus pseudomycoides]PED07019.1 2,3-dihydro-2,3-dihydroxybenzoate dehydrogenase [Bacillus pseudomycoides]PEI95015.1 2,3-dihydro-2,3-dihydroxybenzoate dehydrogenase [Bacillus pseudomycoides]PEK29651.1 2,3-dihydro-2,3-dihydroxybenzoate dehydrogenase [Bacillus pseudomycoides]PEM69757.1 2,3-dihydro-2,3-dihydroxybenzoate dehydrogenase [Bacillus pseudomycoides]PEO21660.1 2,3-dihydro-2,3-dihydroxybenzoate dehydrogenase [Bacillus pseudomycoides]